MKKGFTLIELLAVILILGIIALIAIPQVTNVIANAHKGASETSAEHYIGAVNTKIALSKLDSNSTNDISDGVIKDISTIPVDVTGETPTSGVIVVEDGMVKSAELEEDGYSVSCNEKGKCTVIDKYVYSMVKLNSADDNNLMQEVPTDKKAYLKYPIIDGKLGSPKGCINENGTEVCLNNRTEEYSIAKKKILDYFGYDSTWVENLNNTYPAYKEYYKTAGDSSVYCRFSVTDRFLYCSNSVVMLEIEGGHVDAIDYVARKNCYVSTNNDASCFGI